MKLIKSKTAIVLNSLRFALICSGFMAHSKLLNAKSIFQPIQFNISSRFKCQNSSIETIQYCISTPFNSIRAIDRTILGATTPGQSGPGSDCNERVFHILQISSITGTAPSDCLVSYPGHLRESYPAAEMQSVYSTAPAD